MDDAPTSGQFIIINQPVQPKNTIGRYLVFHSDLIIKKRVPQMIYSYNEFSNVVKYPFTNI